MDLFQVYTCLNEAVFYSEPLKNMVRATWDKAFAGGKLEQILSFADYGIRTGIKEALELFKGKPELQYEIVFDAEGGFSTKVTLNAKELSEDLRIHFDTAVVVWAEQNGYTYNPDDGTLKHSGTNEPMSSEKFMELNKNEDKCLSKFSSEVLKLNTKHLAPTITPLSMKP